jgi:hypothetical protein
VVHLSRGICRLDFDLCRDVQFLINFELLPYYARELDGRYDPLHDIVIKGDYIVNDWIYPQGGSGKLFSRKTVELLEPLKFRSGLC